MWDLGIDDSQKWILAKMVLHSLIRWQGLFVQFIYEIGMQKMVTGIVTYLELFCAEITENIE